MQEVHLSVWTLYETHSKGRNKDEHVWKTLYYFDFSVLADYMTFYELLHW